MPRKLRMKNPGAIYHVMNRRDRREDIFKDDLDRERYLAALDESCGKTQWQIHAYCLMGNHVVVAVTARCGDAPTTPPRPQPISTAAAPH